MSSLKNETTPSEKDSFGVKIIDFGYVPIESLDDLDTNIDVLQALDPRIIGKFKGPNESLIQSLLESVQLKEEK